MVQGDVVDQLHDDDGLPDSGATEQTDFPALAVGLEQVHDLNTGFQYLGLGFLIFEFRSRPVNRIGLLGLDRTLFIDRFTKHVDETTECFTANRHRDRGPRVVDIHPARQSVSGRHCDAADPVFTQMRSYFERNLHGRRASRFILILCNVDRIVDIRELAGRKFHVHDRSDDLNDFSCTHEFTSFAQVLSSECIVLRADGLPDSALSTSYLF